MPGIHTQPDPDMIAAALSALWSRTRDAVLGRVAVLESAAVAARDDSLSAADRGLAEQDAHKLAGVLGTFGFHEGSRLAREAEAILQSDTAMSIAGVARIADIASLLQRELSPLRQ